MPKPAPFSLKILVVLLLCACLSTLAPAAVAEEPATIRIGAILPLSGPVSFAGVGIQRGMELALKDFATHNIDVTFEDDRSADRKAAVAAAKKLISIDKSTVVFNSVVNTVEAIAPILNKSKVPGIVVWDNNRTIAELGEYVFGMGFSTELAGEDMAVHAHQQLDVSKVSIISIHDEWSELISDAFKKKFESLGGKVVLSEQFDLGTTDFRSLILRIKASESGAVYAPLWGQSVLSFINQLRELKYKGAILTGDGFSDNEVSQLGPGANNIAFTQVWLNNPTLFQKYKKAYGEEVPSINLGFVALGYDSIKLIAALADHLKQKKLPLTSETVKNNLVGFEFDGVSEKTSFSSKRVADKRESILIVKNGGIEKFSGDGRG